MRPAHIRLFLLFCGIYLSSSLPTGAQQGHRVTTRAVTVNSTTQWNNWQLPTHAIDFTADGAVKPHFFRERFDILDDVETFTRPIIDFRRRRGQSATLNVDSTETLDVKGEIILDNKDIPIYSYFFRPGISRVGSNPATAANILDDDPTTFWEPNPQDPVDDWWIEVDLGRVVTVDSLVLHFVEETLGDPFFSSGSSPRPIKNQCKSM